MVLTAMGTLRGSGYAMAMTGAMIGWLAAASTAVLLPQQVSAQPDGADGVPPLTSAASAPREGVHIEMGQTARKARKPTTSVQPTATAAFAPPREKPPLHQVSAEQPSAEQAAPADLGPPDGRQEPAAGATEPPSGGKVLAARPPEAVVAETADEDRGPQASPPRASRLPDAIASLAFAPDSAELSSDAERVLKDLAARFSAEDQAFRLQLMAFAGGEDISASKARRLSLARALAVRSYLMANGIEGTRMDVRALGDRTLGPAADTPQNRVDIAMIKR